jgi:hypothetical protein
MTQENSQTETEEVLLAPFDLLEGISESARMRPFDVIDRVAFRFQLI